MHGKISAPRARGEISLKKREDISLTPSNAASLSTYLDKVAAARVRATQAKHGQAIMKVSVIKGLFRNLPATLKLNLPWNLIFIKC